MTRYVVIWLALLLRVACLLLFPALAVWAWRPGSARLLWSLTGAAVAVVLLFASFAASTAGGNALAATCGYRYTASGSLLLLGVTLGLPMVAAALAVQTAAARLASRVGLYALGLLVALLAWIGGLVGALWVYYAAAR